MGIAPHCLPEVIQTIYYNAHCNYALKTGLVACKIKLNSQWQPLFKTARISIIKIQTLDPRN